MIAFRTEGKDVKVYPAEREDRPVVYLNTCFYDDDKIRDFLQGPDCPDFSLVTISGLQWNSDMVPWEIPFSEKVEPYRGGADGYLRVLTEKILPQAEEALAGTPPWRGIAGYSLGGLFAVYSAYRTDAFSRAVSASGSLWLPGIKEYVFSHEMKRVPDCVYFSLGDKECHASVPVFRPVQANTEEIEAFYREKGIDTVFVLNEGDHYRQCNERCAAGIRWILNR